MMGYENEAKCLPRGNELHLFPAVVISPARDEVGALWANRLRMYPAESGTSELVATDCLHVEHQKTFANSD